MYCHNTPRRGVLAIATFLALTLPSVPASSDSAAAVTSPSLTPVAATYSPTNATLRTASRKQLVFGHQSVGRNILGGVTELYRSRDMAPPAIVKWTRSTPTGTRGWIAHARIGENRDPLSKIVAFEVKVKSTRGSPDAALMKLCYVDITARTDINSVFRAYKRTVARIKAARPSLVVLHATVPLTSGDRASNVKRQQYNQLVRTTFRKSRIVDIARVESTTPSGGRVTGVLNGNRYYALYSGYTDDGGHLNARGSRLVAAELLRVVAAS